MLTDEAERLVKKMDDDHITGRQALKTAIPPGCDFCLDHTLQLYDEQREYTPLVESFAGYANVATVCTGAQAISVYIALSRDGDGQAGLGLRSLVSMYINLYTRLIFVNGQRTEAAPAPVV
jgi:hypothetical protein